MLEWFNESGMGANLKEIGENIVGGDPTDASADANEISIKNAYSFSNLRFTFPVTDRKTILKFPAYLQNFSDSFTPNWNSQQVFGRSDPIAIYQGTSRNISLSFAIPAFDSTDANFNLGKLNRLIKNLYPVYNSFGGTKNTAFEGNRVITGAPLVRIRFANLINNPNKPGMGLLGFITNLSVDMSPSKGYFIESGMLSLGALFPRVIAFNFSFTPLHEETLGWVDGQNGEWFGQSEDFPYITKARLGDLVSATAGAVGLGENVGFTKMFSSTLGIGG